MGNRFAANDVAFYALDRRGCGISDGARSEIAPVSEALDDLHAAIAKVRDAIGPEVPLTLFGHCLGGSFLAALLQAPGFDVRSDAIVFCSAWLGRLHKTLNAEARACIVNEAGSALWDAGLRPSDFTDETRYRTFIELDPLATRAITTRSRANLLRLEESYVGRVFTGQKPPIYISGDADPVIDLREARDSFRSLAPKSGRIVSLSTDKHYLFFTEVRDGLVDWVSHMTTRPEVMCNG